MKIEDGGAAFPRTPDTEFLHGYDGMSLRDYFAAQALIAIVINDPHKNVHVTNIAAEAYCIAEAMLEERKK